jgi:hypothetical protein
VELVDFASLLVAGTVLAGFVRGVSSWVFAPYGGKPRAGLYGWRGWVYLTLWLWPILLGSALGLVPGLPAPEFMGSDLSGKVLWYALAGVLSSTLYDAIRSWIKHQTGLKDSLRPQPPGPKDSENAG